MEKTLIWPQTNVTYCLGSCPTRLTYFNIQRTEKYGIAMCYLMAKELQPGHNPQELGGRPILDSTCGFIHRSQFDGIYMICFKGQVLQDKPNILGGYCSFMCIQYNFLFSLTFWGVLWWPLREPAIKRELKITILRKLLKLLFSSTLDGIFALKVMVSRSLISTKHGIE